MAETPREPDRFEAKAKELCLTEWRTIAAALRAEHDDALERAAQWCESQIAGPDTTAQNRWIASRIRALKSPAAAPAAERTQCQCIIGAVAASCVYATPDRPCECSCHAPPSEPAAPEKDLLPPCTCHYAAAEFCKYHGPRLRAERAASVAPAPLLPRVLAALEQEASAHDDFDSTYEHAAALALRALAAELRAYIAEREPAEKRIAELEAALRDALNAAHHHVQAGQHWICSEPFACEEECPCAKLAARAAKAKGEGT